MALKDIAIAGVYSTQQAWQLPGRSSLDLTLEALDGALADAGLTRDDVDGVALDWAGPGGIVDEPASWGRLLGHDLAWTSDGQLDAAGVRGVLKGAAAISAGLCEVVAVGGGMALRRASGIPVGTNRAGAVEFTDVWGAYVLPMFALVAARHMHEYGTTSEQLAKVAVTIRNLGYDNPEAVMFGKPQITVHDVLQSRMIASPFHLLDCCIAAEGGAALILTRVERARDLNHSVVRVLGGGMEYHFAPYSNPAILRDIRACGTSAIGRAFGLAGLRVSDLDVAALYDANSFEVLHQLEVIGLCPEGEGGPYVDDIGIGLDAPLPVNPDGGCLAYAWNGTQQQTLKVIEIVRQLRGHAIHQVDHAEVGFVANAGSGAGHLEALILGRM